MAGGDVFLHLSAKTLCNTFELALFTDLKHIYIYIYQMSLTSFSGVRSNDMKTVHHTDTSQLIVEDAHDEEGHVCHHVTCCDTCSRKLYPGGFRKEFRKTTSIAIPLVSK